jgi:hypothetical protein
MKRLWGNGRFARSAKRSEEASFFHETFRTERRQVRKKSGEVFLQERLYKTLFSGLQAPCLCEVAPRRLRPVEIVKCGRAFDRSREDGNMICGIYAEAPERYDFLI